MFFLIKRIKEYFISYKSYKKIINYNIHSRNPFFMLAKKYLPYNKKSIILDIGGGNGDFFKLLNIDKEYENSYILERNIDTIKQNNNLLDNIIKYDAPQKIPFLDDSVDMIHVSHLLEHLKNSDVYKLLKEFDRILKKKGILIISGPIFWNGFYDDLSHIKPYNPQVFINYLTRTSKERTMQIISDRYKIKELVYRHKSKILGENIYAKNYIFYIFLRVVFFLLALLGIRKYIKTGFTIVFIKE